MTNIPAAWYPDPSDASRWRWWDGAAWTDQYAPREVPPTTEVAETTTAPASPAFSALMHQSSIDTPPTLSEIVNQLRVEEPRHPLDEQIELVGETHYVKGVRRTFRDHAMPITARGTTLDEVHCILVPERWNQYDSNAVAVLVGVHHVGYIPADMAVDYSPGLLRLAADGSLASGLARIWAKDESGMLRARVTVRLPEATAFA